MKACAMSLGAYCCSWGGNGGSLPLLQKISYLGFNLGRDLQL